MKKITKRIDIQAKPKAVYDFLTNPNNLPTVWPSMIEVSNVQRKNDGGHEFDWVYKMAGIRFHGHSHAVRVEPEKYVEVRSEGGIGAIFRWHYEPHDGGTRITLDVEYTIPTPVIGKAAEIVVAKMNEREATMVLENTKATLEATLQKEKPRANGTRGRAHP
jgi:carbon monoxide dehydrogenase subunit G